MSTGSTTILPLRPFESIGRGVLSFIHYLGGMGLLAMTVIRSFFRPRGDAPSLFPAVLRQTDRIFHFAMPLVAIVHVGLGSFMAMQAYFGATFLDGIGPVVGVGLIRNVAPLMSGMILAAIYAAQFTTELRKPDRGHFDQDPNWIPDRGLTLDSNQTVFVEIEPARLAATRMIAAVLAGPVMSAWASLVGLAVGFAVAASMLKVNVPAFFDMFMEMLWVRDVVGVFAKGMAFGLAGAWYACYEGLRHDYEQTSTPEAVVRAISLSGVTILLMNSAWFLIFYHAGPAFGPTVLAPPQL
jgi:phospholipid/cholesterol/gamma-HCH transport system permease protein